MSLSFLPPWDFLISPTKLSVTTDSLQGKNDPSPTQYWLRTLAQALTAV